MADQFAVIKTGGKQYIVREGDVLRIEKLATEKDNERKEGDKLVFDKVLLVDDGDSTSIGTPYIEGASVEATFLKAGRTRKVLVLSYKAKSNYRKKNTHRQHYLEVKIEKIK
ncbi:MAG: 50S ribosomal protein L21 [Candidatus Vogelbacteria bacterium CG10_big_fil_rev_8_21_14_0_10_45_14]|uniref:Large ribosomal subunit protein bL21 n=1 Tax=Candidatus Vogelbacteria bacterium CG10_big_fil_rev_8_21_14_0_10_45_14 TaxID=1975042 RepID=A0A2H0RJQ1_9BACT|nr:MAG: 50S ribosomal protein L21 [Candidatus Vogelbacteria bacterium CG10_big_fil_rev_8_21_14_0_10_45_14]